MFKRLYHILALLAMINLFTVAGLVGFLITTGRLNAERADQIGAVLRGEWPESTAPTTQPAAASAAPEASGAEIARLQARKQYYDLLAERHKREIEDRQTLGKEIQLETIRLLDLIERKEKAFKEQKQQLQQESAQIGQERQLEVFSKIEPEQAKQLLRSQMKEPDAVRLMLQMDASRVSKIVNACETPEEKLWIGRILNQIGESQEE